MEGENARWPRDALLSTWERSGAYEKTSQNSELLDPIHERPVWMKHLVSMVSVSGYRYGPD